MNGKQGNELSVVIPVRNEQDILQAALRNLSVHLDRIVGTGQWELVVCENASTDSTLKILVAFQQDHPSMRIHQLPSANIGAAVKKGIDSAQGKYIYITDVDAWDAEFLRNAWSMKEDQDLIIGSKRLVPGHSKLPLCRRILTISLNFILRHVFYFRGTDTHGQRLLNRERFRPLVLQTVSQRGYFDTELTLRAERAGFRIAELPVRIQELRPPRNPLPVKIFWALVGLGRLWLALRHCSYAGAFSRRSSNTE